ncbi:MAG: hypothetical protein MJY97_01220 [Bacteroidales bacterium]|nr:hypothetical protein [Bacteroidales bacterium]
MKTELPHNFLMMFGAWAFNTNLKASAWIYNVWHDDPELAKHFHFKYLDYFDNGYDQGQAIIKFICTLDSNNVAILTNYIINYCRKSFDEFRYSY